MNKTLLIAGALAVVALIIKGKKAEMVAAGTSKLTSTGGASSPGMPKASSAPWWTYAGSWANTSGG